MPISSRFVAQSTTILLAVGFLALLVIVGMTVWLGERARVYADTAVVERESRNAAVELRDALRTAEGSQRGYLVTGNEIYLAPFDTAKAQAQRQLTTLSTALGADSASAPMLRKLTTVVADKIAEMDNTIALKSAGKDAEALTVVRSNRGKALMDEANVFLYAVILASNERLAAGSVEQRENAAMLRWVSLIGAVVIVAVIGGVVVLVARYTGEISQARDEVRSINLSLEERVQRRTADLALARERAEVLLAEVNHRVANSLQLAAALVKLQAHAVTEPSAKAALDETQARITAIGLIHKRLYSSGDARSVALDEYLRGLLEHLETAMRAEGHTASLRHDIDAIRLPTDASVSLGVVVTEWVTNAFKYAYPEHPGEIRVKLKRTAANRAELVVEDDGVGRSEAAPARGTGLGTRIVNGMAGSLEATIAYIGRAPGTTARLIFPVPAE